MRFLMVAAGLALVSGGAMAQAPAQVSQEEMLCIFDQIPDAEARMLVDVVINKKKADQAKIDAAMKKAHDVCGKKYGWNDDLHVAGEEIAIGGMVNGVVSSALEDAGFKDLKKLEGILDGLSDEDYDVVLNGDYEKNAAVKPKLVQQVKAAGVPEKSVDMAVLLIETMAITDEAMNWFEDSKSAPAAKAN